MTTRNLDYLLRPGSVAVIGASNEPGTIGAAIMRNLLEADFPGLIFPVTAEYESVAGVLAYHNLARLRRVPDLAVICSDAQTVPGLIEELARLGTKAAIVLASDVRTEVDSARGSAQALMLRAAKPVLLRILGPNCMGVINPTLRLNASFAPGNALPGRIAFVSQSGALAASVLDWARSKGIGFSFFVSLGDSIDVDAGDLLDYLGADPDTKAILLYIESVKAARKFMSAARAAARNKPVIVVKAGRTAEGAQAAATHTAALAGADAVFDAAIRRAGMLRVDSTEELFAAVETLARSRPLAGDRLVILTNGGGPGVLATDTLIRGAGRLAQLSQATVERLDCELKHGRWSGANPVDIRGDAGAKEHAAALKTLAAEPQADAVVFIHAPNAIVPAIDVAQACAPVAKSAALNVFSCWPGGSAIEAARRVFADAQLPTYRTPEAAVRAFLQLADYRRNQDLLIQVPPSFAEQFTPDMQKASEIIAGALADGRDQLTEPEAKSILAAYAIPVVETYAVASADEAVQVADKIGYPVALKVMSPDLAHKAEVGGVSLNLEDAHELRLAARDIARRLQTLRPGARLTGFTVQRMIRTLGTPRVRTSGHELLVGVATDATFGRVILFGHGGSRAEAIGDSAVGLPPLNIALARDLVSRTRVCRLLAADGDRAPADMQAVYLTLVKISQLVVDHPEIVALDINPLIASEQGVVALDARMRLEAVKGSRTARLAIRPYPARWEHAVEVGGRPVLIRPVRPEDTPQHADFLAKISPEDLQLRFFHQIGAGPITDVARYTQIDYDRQMVFIATAMTETGERETLGEARAASDPDHSRAEVAIVVRSDFKRRGLGRLLAQHLIRYLRDRGTEEAYGFVRADNAPVLELAQALGFRVERLGESDTMLVSLDLPRAPEPRKVELF